MVADLPLVRDNGLIIWVGRSFEPRTGCSVKLSQPRLLAHLLT